MLKANRDLAVRAVNEPRDTNAQDHGRNRQQQDARCGPKMLNTLANCALGIMHTTIATFVRPTLL